MSTTNIQVLKPSREKPASGDIFALQLPDDQYLFGASAGLLDGSAGIYLDYWPPAASVAQSCCIGSGGRRWQIRALGDLRACWCRLSGYYLGIRIVV